MGTEQSCSTRHIVHYQLTWQVLKEEDNATDLCNHIINATSTKQFSAIDYHIQKQSNGNGLLTAAPLFLEILRQFKPTVLLVVYPLQSTQVMITDKEIQHVVDSERYTVTWIIVRSFESQYCYSLCIFIVQKVYDTDEI